MAEKLLNNDFERNITEWRDTKSWFAQLVQGRLTDEYITYITTSPDYKNKVAYHYVLVYDYHLQNLKRFQTETNSILEGIRRRFKK